MSTDRRYASLLANAERIRTLKAAIDSAFKLRERDTEHHDAWKAACAVFHSQYDELAFPGGYESARERIRSGDAAAIESALRFLECRPYFFRSGYMFEALMRAVKRAELSQTQAERFKVVVHRHAEHRARRREAHGA